MILFVRSTKDYIHRHSSFRTIYQDDYTVYEIPSPYNIQNNGTRIRLCKSLSMTWQFMPDPILADLEGLGHTLDCATRQSGP